MPDANNTANSANSATASETASATYLDNAATSFPKPECVYVAADAYLRGNGAAFGRGSYAAADDASRIVAQCRQRIAGLLDIKSSDQIAFTFNCTDSLNLLLRGILREGFRVITTTLEHNSVLRPLRQLQHELHLDVVRVDFDPLTGETDLNAVQRELTTSPTNLVVINHASNVTGVVQPIAQITELAHRHGAQVLLDAAQTAGHVPFSVSELNIDYLAAAGHKGLLGPLGTGILYVAEGLEQQLRPVRSGGTGPDSESLNQPTQMPARLESGNMNMPGLAGLNAAAQWLLDTGIDVVHERLHGFRNQLVNQLSDISGVTVFCPDTAQPNAGIVSLTIAGIDSREAAAILDQSFHIRCRAGLHCAPLVHETLQTKAQGGTIRLSPGPFTLPNTINLATEGIRAIASEFSAAGNQN